MTIDITNMSLATRLDVGTQPSDFSYDVAPKLNVGQMDINLDPKNINVQLTGGFVTKIASVFVPFIKGTLVPQMIAQVKTQATQAINVTANQDLQKYGTQVEIPYLAGVTFDYAQEMNGI